MTLSMNDGLLHYGKKGMKWGQRLAERRTDKTAKKDAKKYADAKMFYGKGAGTKRKLLKAELDKKRKTIPNYEKQFNKHVANVDMAKSASKAKRVRKTKDVAYRTKVNARKVNKVAGPLVVAAGANYYRKNQTEINRKIKSAYNSLRR